MYVQLYNNKLYIKYAKDNACTFVVSNIIENLKK